jgi:hypothetical protein
MDFKLKYGFFMYFSWSVFGKCFLADKWTGEDGGLKELKRWGVEVIRTF